MQEPFEICPQVFDDSELEFIKSCGDASTTETQTGLLTRTKSTIALPSKITKKLEKAVQKSSYYSSFKLLSPTTFEKFILSKYDLGQGFDIHQDVSQHSFLSNSEHDRKITIMVLLDNNYEGGDFFIHDVGLDAPFLITLQPGDALLMPSFYEHSMRDITTGQRVSLTTWVLGPRWC